MDAKRHGLVVVGAVPLLSGAQHGRGRLRGASVHRRAHVGKLRIGRSIIKNADLRINFSVASTGVRSRASAATIYWEARFDTFWWIASSNHRRLRCIGFAF